MVLDAATIKVYFDNRILLIGDEVFMVKLIKSTVKCYRKKTKKTVGGKKKTYEYNQYLVPLKISDQLECSQDVFVVSESELQGMLDEEGQLVGDRKELQRHIDVYQKELDELEWKHGELSRSYKELVAKNTKNNQQIRQLTAELENIHLQNQELENDLKIERENHEVLEKKHQLEVKKSQILEEELSKHKGDFWTAIKSKLASKEEKDL
jgi:chromosome segregation ATPase